MFFLISSLILLSLSYLLAKRKRRYRKYLIIINMVISVTYIIWRFTTIPYFSVVSIVLGVILIVAELIGWFQFSIFQLLFFKEQKQEEKTLDNYQKHELPSVDVLICTYNEPVSLLQKTLVAALNMNYPEEKLNVYICDDGSRLEVRNLCKKHGAHWITREDHENAKAGNINHALPKTSGDLFLLLDADMIPKEEFLLKTVGYFADEDVAFVQTPQVFYNTDMYQNNFKSNIPNEQDFFMRDVQEARAAINAVLHVGTNAVFRRKYVDEIGGFPTCSITADMAVGMLLHANQYRGIFVNEELAYGLSATSYTDLLKQRDRWCRGNLQVMSKLWRKSVANLSLGQKIAYLDGISYWFSSIQKIIYLAMPIIYMLIGIPILDATFSEIVMFFIPYFYGQQLIFKALSSNTRSIKWSHIYDTAMAPHLTVSIFKHLLNLKSVFTVTPKEVDAERGYYQFRIVIPHMLLTVLTFVSWYTGLQHIQANSMTAPAFLINFLFSIFNLYGLIICLYVAYQKPFSPDSLAMPITVGIKTTTDGIIETFSLQYYKDNKAGIAIDRPYSFQLNQEVWFSYDGRNYLKARITEIKEKQIELLFSEHEKEALHAYMHYYVKYLHTPYSLYEAE